MSNHTDHIERMSKSRKVALGLMVLSRYSDDVAAGHEKILAGAADCVPGGDEYNDLVSWGWAYDEDLECWYTFV